MAPQKVELAHEPDFVLGRLTVFPSRRELVRDDGAREVLEHRVMQVLIALAKAQGAIITRDELTQSCWNGRVVGEDAINRVMSRLRKTAGGIGVGSFGVETVTRIGYRLTGDAIAPDGRATSTMPKGRDSGVIHRYGPTRRTFMIGAIAAATGGAVLLYRQLTRSAVPPEVVTLMTQGALALEQVSFDAHNDAIGAFQRVVEIAPDYADGWGMLGYAYGFLSPFRSSAVAEEMRVRAKAAAQRAFELDPGNANAELALALALPLRGYWLEREQGFRRALAREPDNDHALRLLATNMVFTGRASDAVPIYEQIRRRPLTASVYANYIESLWNAGLLEEADHAMDAAARLYPTHSMVWNIRFQIYQFGGRTGKAIAMVQEQFTRQNQGEETMEAVLAVARAIESGDPAQADAVMTRQMQLANMSPGGAENAVRIASALGRVDEAFAITHAYYFARGFTVPDRQSPTSDFYWPQNERPTRPLFEPVTRPMRADPRFGPLVEELGLERYWRESGSQPDYRRA